jgi:hypothetical protein
MVAFTSACMRIFYNLFVGYIYAKRGEQPGQGIIGGNGLLVYPLPAFATYIFKGVEISQGVQTWEVCIWSSESQDANASTTEIHYDLPQQVRLIIHCRICGFQTKLRRSCMLCQLLCFIKQLIQVFTAEIPSA